MIGKTLRYFRKSKNLTLDYVSKDIITIPFLSKVERDLSDISFKNLLLLIDKIGIDIIEFTHMYNKFSNKEYFTIKQLHTYFVNKDINSLKDILNSNNKTNLLFNNSNIYNLLIKLLLHHLKEYKIKSNEILDIKNYLMDLSTWTYYDLYLYCQSTSFYNHNTMINFSNLALKIYKRYYDELDMNFSVIFMLLNNSIIQCLKNNDINNAEYFYKILLKEKINNRDYFHKIKIKSLYSLILYKKNDKTTAINELSYILKTLKYINDDKNNDTLSFLSTFLKPLDFENLISKYNYDND